MASSGLEAERWSGWGLATRGASARLGAVIALLASSVATSAQGLPTPGCLDGGAPAVVDTVGPGLAVLLADGRELRLLGIDPAPEQAPPRAAAGAARTMLGQWLVGRTVQVEPLAAAPDRWGRTPALVFATLPGDPATDGARVSVSEALLDAGLARARPDPLVSACWPTYRMLEDRARTAGLGLWAEPWSAAVQGDDRAGLARRTGTMAVVEGRITRVSAGRARTYLGFDPPGRDGFTITIERRVAAALQKAGADPTAWRGHHVKVRGFLDDRFGMQIELTSRDQIEFIEP